MTVRFSGVSNELAMVFRVKICGVKTVEDAQIATEAGADAIGLNFFEGSPRFVSATAAAKIAAQAPPNVQRIGVFVNASTDTIRRTVNESALDFVQLHGDEPPRFLAELAGLKIIRAFRCKNGLAPVRDYLDECTDLPAAVLIDAYEPGSYGGTGKTVHWPDLLTAREFIGDLPLILAGGLTQSNVRIAIQTARPNGVDTASGVEKDQHCRKDAALCRAFVAEANRGFLGDI